MEGIQTMEILNREKIGEKLAVLREEKHLSQTEVAEALGYKRGQIWQFERGTGLTIENLAKLAFFYGKTIEYFIMEN